MKKNSDRPSSYSYTALVKKTDNGLYYAEFPDFKIPLPPDYDHYCFARTYYYETLDDCVGSAADYLGNFISTDEEYWTKNKATPFEDVKEDAETIMKHLVVVYMDTYRRRHTAMVSFCVEIPLWLKQKGDDEGVDYGEVLASALEEKFGLSEGEYDDYDDYDDED